MSLMDTMPQVTAGPTWTVPSVIIVNHGDQHLIVEFVPAEQHYYTVGKVIGHLKDDDAVDSLQRAIGRANTGTH